MDGGDESLVRAFLSERDEACPMCMYNLRGGGAVCPECGAEVELRLVQRGARVWVDEGQYEPPALTAEEAARRERRSRMAAGVVWLGVGAAVWGNLGLMSLAFLISAASLWMGADKESIVRRYARMETRNRYWRATRSSWLTFTGVVVLVAALLIRGGA